MHSNVNEANNMLDTVFEVHRGGIVFSLLNKKDRSMNEAVPGKWEVAESAISAPCRILRSGPALPSARPASFRILSAFW